jgi:hypothetical protein
MKSLAIDFEYLKDAKLISGKVPPASLIDAAFARKAVAELGPYVKK